MSKALFLCSGTGSVGKPFKDAGRGVTDVDWDKRRYHVDICTDITTWDYKSAFEPGYFDVIWASPDCTQYSRANLTGPPRVLEKADRLVQSCRSIIEYFCPVMWFLENPDSELLKQGHVSRVCHTYA